MITRSLLGALGLGGRSRRSKVKVGFEVNGVMNNYFISYLISDYSVPLAKGLDDL
jgi:hypothetical protein